MRRSFTLARALLLPLAFVLALPSASAHANLASADPAPNGHVDAGATLVTLHFSEEVERSFTSVDVLDANTRASFAEGPVVFDDAHPDTIRRSLRPLADGIYTVEWKALSRDSHSTRGSFLVSVGAAHLTNPPKVDANQHADDLGVMLREGPPRFLYYLGAFVAVGVPFFHLVVDRSRAPRRPALVALAGSLVAFAAAYVGLFLLADRTGLSFSASASTAAGTSFDWRGTLAGAAAVAFVVAVALPRARALALGAGGALALASLVAAALGSHAAADRDLRTVGIAVDVLHLAMGALWIGGVVALAMASRGRSADETGALIGRFTPLALLSVAVVLATGTYASLRRIPAWSDLWSTTYGELVSAKLLLLAALVGFGAFHKQVMGPRLRAGTARPQTFRRALVAEALVMTVVLVAAGALASSSPPDTSVATGHQGDLGFTTLNQQTQSTHVVLMVAPAPVVVGIQNLTIQLHPLKGNLGPNSAVTLKIAAPGEREPDAFVDPGPTRVAEDEWQTQGGYFTGPGAWQVWVLVQRPEVGEFAKLEFTVNVAAA